MAMLNGRVHRETNARPIVRLEIERPRLHPIRADGFTAVFGVSRAGVVVMHGVVGQRPLLRASRLRGYSSVGS